MISFSINIFIYIMTIIQSGEKKISAKILILDIRFRSLFSFFFTVIKKEISIGDITIRILFANETRHCMPGN